MIVYGNTLSPFVRKTLEISVLAPYLLPDGPEDAPAT